MFHNYFKTAWRNLIRNKVFSTIKILGLSLGLTVCMLIFLYTKDEISYDRFHENTPNLFRVIQTLQRGEAAANTIGVTNSIVGETFAKEIPEVEQFVRINVDDVAVKKQSETFTENCMFADSNFFSVFTFPLLHGNKNTALQDPNSVVLSEEMARKYFGTTDAVGKMLQIKKEDEFESYTVKAIAKNIPENSSIKAGMFFPIQYSLQERPNQWYGGSLTTFLLLSSKANVQVAEKKMQDLYNKRVSEFLAKAEKERGIKLTAALSIQPITDIHLSKNAGASNALTDPSDPAYSYILTCIAAFILIIASINFINLAIAQSLKRSKEIGIRKVIGGTRGQLIRQFLAESFLVSLVAFVIAVGLTQLLLPFFNEMANKQLNLSYLSDSYLYLGFFLLLLVTSFISGFYPSLVLSAFQPVKVLYNKQKLMGKSYFTNGLIVLQFALAIFLVIGTVAVYSQLNLLLHADLGYDSKNLVRIDLPPGSERNRLADLFRNELSNQPNIVSVALKNDGEMLSGVRAGDRQVDVEYNKIDNHYLPILKIPVLAGRNFSPEYPSDSSHAAIVNEAFVKEAGWKLSDAVGKTIISIEDTNRELFIVGIIKNYHSASLREKISPALFSMNPKMSFGEIWVKISPDKIPEALATLRSTFEKLVPDFPYSYQFMDDINARRYDAEARWKQIISIASGLFIFISCIGLLGLVMLSIEQRTKEIGIRKLLGAAVSRIILIISKEFIVLIVIAFAIAVPAGYYFVSKWLQDFAYRIDIGWGMFLIAGIATLFVALATIAFQAIKAAMANPVKSLRTE